MSVRTDWNVAATPPVGDPKKQMHMKSFGTEQEAKEYAAELLKGGHMNIKIARAMFTERVVPLDWKLGDPPRTNNA